MGFRVGWSEDAEEDADARRRRIYALNDVMRSQPKKSKRRRPLVTATNGCGGTWTLDPTRSESLEPFLVAVGAPKLVARLVGTRGKPMTVTVSGRALTVAVEGKDAEKFDLDGDSTIQTP